MKLFRILFIALAIFNLVVISTQAKDMVIKEPPKSLSKYYPPESKQPKWIQQMHKMSSHFGGVFLNLKEKDFENVDKHADKLVEEYKKTSEMVPEWKNILISKPQRRLPPPRPTILRRREKLQEDWVRLVENVMQKMKYRYGQNFIGPVFIK